MLTFAKNVVQKLVVNARHVGKRMGNQAVARVKSVTNHHSQVTLLQYLLDYRLFLRRIGGKTCKFPFKKRGVCPNGHD
jgi:hypothetical protein